MDGSADKEFTGNAGEHRRCRYDPWVGKMPWNRKWQPPPIFSPEKNLMDRGAWWLQSMGSQRVRHG